MWHVGTKHVSMMVLCAVALHFSWAISIVLDYHTLDSTPVHAIYKWLPYNHAVALLCFSVAVAAFFGAVSNSVKWALALLIPQQIVLLFSMAGVLEAFYLSQSADGIIRPIGFIVGNQIGLVWVCVMHTFAIFSHVARIRNGG